MYACSLCSLAHYCWHKNYTISSLLSHMCLSLVNLPPYSPDLNPIEKFWSWLKRQIKNIINKFTSLDEAIDHMFVN
ncbi:MAG: transposase [Holosporales bacterium]|nr:transposase [Holosporales bacterium]